MTDAERLARIRDLYDRLPKIECRGKCWNSCGPIDMSEAERSRLHDLGVDIPEWSRLRHLAWANDEKWPTCPALGALHQCTVYDDRPLICRLWGVAESMVCPHGCKPERYLTDEEGYELILTVAELGGSRLTQEPRLRHIIASALADEKAGPLVRRLIRGDQSVEGEAAAAIRELRDA